MNKRLTMLLVVALATMGVLLAPSAFGAKGGGGGGKGGGGGGGGGGTATNTPIVFVNGYRSWGGGTSNVKNKFSSAGYTNLSTFSYDSTARIADSARKLSDYISNIKSSTGAASVNGVGHSLGGLVLSKSSASKTVAMGSPFKGTDTAYLCFDASCYDMRPPGPGGSASACVWSTCDEIINPDSSAQCSGKSCGCVSHNSIDGTSVAWDVARSTVG